MIFSLSDVVIPPSEGGILCASSRIFDGFIQNRFFFFFLSGSLFPPNEI
jgi:hypothetical protein